MDIHGHLPSDFVEDAETSDPTKLRTHMEPSTAERFEVRTDYLQ